MAYILRPNEDLQQYTEEVALRVGVGGAETAPFGAINVRRGDKQQEAQIHKTREYAEAIRNASMQHGFSQVLISSDSDEVYSSLPGMVPELSFHWIPFEMWKIKPHAGRLLAAKYIDNVHTADADRVTKRPTHDEAQLLMVQIFMLARARVLVGTLTSNFALLVYDLMAQQRPGFDPHMVDLDGNSYYSCSCKDPVPYGPAYGLAGYNAQVQHISHEAAEVARIQRENLRKQQAALAARRDAKAKAEAKTATHTAELERARRALSHRHAPASPASDAAHRAAKSVAGEASGLA